MQSDVSSRNLKNSRAPWYTIVSILVVIIAMTIESNQYLHGQITGGNMSTSTESANVNSSETADKILHRGIGCVRRI